MTDDVKQLSTIQRSRTRRFDAPLFSRGAQEVDSGDMLSLIQDAPDPDLEDRTPEPTEPPAKKPKRSAEDEGPAEPEWTGLDFLHDYLRKLQWSESDIARIVVGPALSHHTAEGLFRQHAANTAQDQALLIEALKRSGASKVPRDPSLLSGLNPSHLLPDQPADLTQIVSQFAQLPEVQKRRFLALLDEQPASKGRRAADSVSPQAGLGKPLQKAQPAQKAPPTQAEPAAKRESTSKSDDVLTTVLKGSFDTLGIIIKGLLSDGRSGKSPTPGPKGSTPDKKAPPASEDEQTTPQRDESSESQPEEDPSEPPSSEESEDSGTSDSDSDSDSDIDTESDSDSDTDNTPYGPPAPDYLPGDIGGDREPD